MYPVGNVSTYLWLHGARPFMSTNDDIMTKLCSELLLFSVACGDGQTNEFACHLSKVHEPLRFMNHGQWVSSSAGIAL